jgi:hypothetical protein
MKALLIVILLLLRLNAGAQITASVNLKIKQAVKKELSLTMNDFNSYQSVVWGNALIEYASFEEMGFYNFLLQKVDSCNRVVTDCVSEITINKSDIMDNIKRSEGSLPHYKALYDSLSYVLTAKNNSLSAKKDSASKLALSFQRFYDQTKSEFKPTTIKGYLIEHSFRGKNAFGGLVINRYVFELDRRLNVISSSKIE